MDLITKNLQFVLTVLKQNSSDIVPTYAYLTTLHPQTTPVNLSPVTNFLKDGTTWQRLVATQEGYWLLLGSASDQATYTHIASQKLPTIWMMKIMTVRMSRHLNKSMRWNPSNPRNTNTSFIRRTIQRWTQGKSPAVLTPQPTQKDPS